MLFVLTNVVCIETQATIANIVRLLSDLDAIVEASKSDVNDFNHEVDNIVATLMRNKATVPHLLTPVFAAHQNCEDGQFAKHVARKEEVCEEGTIANMSHKQLLKIGVEKFKLIKKKGQWSNCSLS